MRAEVWVLVAATGVLLALVLALLTLTVRLRARVDLLEAASSPSPSSAANVLSTMPGDSTLAALDDPPPAQYVITRVGEAAPTVAAPVFADIVARESVIQAASLVHGLRRALAPETRNRIRFHVRQEIRRSRKQRKVELREVRREWAARQREGRAA